jgi:hypothetical protein
MYPAGLPRKKRGGSALISSGFGVDHAPGSVRFDAGGSSSIKSGWRRAFFSLDNKAIFSKAIRRSFRRPAAHRGAETRLDAELESGDAVAKRRGLRELPFPSPSSAR